MQQSQFNTENKRCSRCATVKPLSDFHKDKSKSDGLNSNCKDCRRVVGSCWYKANTEKVNEKNRRWNEANKEKVAQAASRWVAQNPEKARANAREWQARNPEKMKAARRLQSVRRRALNRGAAGSFTVIEWNNLCVHYGNKCLSCGAIDKPLTIDHVVPLAKGGSNSIENIQPLCQHCNNVKRTKVIDYRPSKP